MVKKRNQEKKSKPSGEYVEVYVKPSKKLKRTVQISVPVEHMEAEQLAEACREAVEGFQSRLSRIMSEGRH